MCRAGWLGVDCSRRDKTWTKSDACPNDCRGSFATRPHGEFGMCLFDKCYCYPGFGGPGCDEIMPLRCPNDCSDRGICRYGKCFCDLGFFGEGCEQRLECPRGRNDTVDCSGNGICHRGRCDCNPGFQGHMCEAKVGLGCKNECNGHGSCEMGGCVCDPGYEGDDCGILNAPQTEKQTPWAEKPRLNNLGARDPDHNKARQNVGSILTGAASGDAVNAANENRRNHRLTFGPLTSGAQFSNAEEVHSALMLSDGSTGLESSRKKARKSDTEDQSSIGRFRSTSETIIKATSTKEEARSSDECNLDCSNRGACVKVDLEHELCDCEPGYHGQHCEFVASTCGKHDDCSGNGVCKYGSCFCNPGFTGKHCDIMEPCPVADCSGHGICKGGTCFCDPGYGGDGCELDTGCPGAVSFRSVGHKDTLVLSCSGHGVCQDGQCYCDESHEGLGCAKPRAGAHECYQDCNSRGLCKDGACFCHEGFAGVSCEIEVQSSNGELKLLSAASDLSSSSLLSTNAPNRYYSFSPLNVAIVGFGACSIGVIFGLILMRYVERRKEPLAMGSGYSVSLASGHYWSLETALQSESNNGEPTTRTVYSSPFVLASSKSTNM